MRRDLQERAERRLFVPFLAFTLFSLHLSLSLSLPRIPVFCSSPVDFMKGFKYVRNYGK